MQTRRLARGPGAWAPASHVRGGNVGQLPGDGVTNLDLQCKDALQKLLKPCNYPAIMPWLNEARTSDKRDVIKLAELAVSGGHGVTHPVSWLQPPQEPVVQNDRGRVRLASTTNITGDRVQTDMLKNRHGADQRNPALERRRQFFQNWTDIPSINSVGDFFHLKDNPIQANPIASVLNESARRGLQRWQVSGPEKGMGTAANAMKALRSVHDAVKRIPKYREHLRDQRPGGQGCSELLYDYATVAPRGSLLHAPYARPDRQLFHSTSAPAINKPLVDPKTVEQISMPGGYVVSLTDVEPLAMLKNRERNCSSNIPLSGGTQEYTTSSKAVGLFALHA